MKVRHAVAGAVATAALIASAGLPAMASPSTAATTTAAGSNQPAHRPLATIRLDVRRPNALSKAWVGQAIPVVVSARFRRTEGVTLEGAPELASDSVFTSQLAREPHQSTEVVDGEPVLVATWTGTVTPSSAGPLALSVKLPVRLRYREAAPPPVLQDPTDGDPFGAFGAMDIDPSDPTSVQRLFRSFQQSFSHDIEQSMGRVHDEATTLEASTATLDVKPLPAAGQPASFSGAVGHFDLRTSVDATQARASEPLTVRTTVQGEGDLDRVDLAGIATSRDWKAYPVTSKVEATSSTTRVGRKTFEQVLIPLHGGALTIPPVALSVFDPVAGAYTTVASAPITLDVDGPLEPAAAPEAAAISKEPATAEPAEGAALPPPAPSSLLESPRSLTLSLAPVLVALLAAAGARLWRRRPDEERSLRRALRQTAKRGSVAAFFDAARRLIVVHSAKRWGVAEASVTPDFLRQHLGPTAEPLVAAIASADALRFGRRDLEPTELWTVRSSIEESLRDAR
jgi:hypothetical protein